MKRKTNTFKLILLSGIFLFLLAVSSKLKTYALSPAVVINEIMYNPASDVSGDEYLELYNTTASAIDISGWCFTAGIGGCFNSGTTLAAHSYGLVSPNASQTLATYSKTTIGTYTGNLSNGGETITLSSASNQVINSLTYDDASPWPTSPDGSGPSLELKDSDLDNSQASSWGASLSPTPGEENSLANIEPPIIHSASQPTALQPASSIKITADVDNATSVSLIYKVMFNAEQSITMNDSGTAGDNTAADGVYTAQIPAQAAGSLVRFKVQANNGDGTATLPSSNESINYRSYIVDDGQSSELPIIRWYIDPSIYDDLVNNHASDDTYVPTIIAVGDQIFDNAKVKVKGQSSTNYPKKKFTFNLASGQSLGSPYFEHPVDEFSINAYFLNLTDLQEKLTWTAFSHYGFDGLQSQYVRVQKNNSTDTSSFLGHYLMIEGYDKGWRERTNHQSGALYKQFDDKKTIKDEDNSDIIALRSNLQSLTGQDLKNYILDNLDVPAIINYDALSAVLMSQDWGFYKNLYEYRDTEGTQRWSLLPWDLDNALAMPIFKSESSPMYFNLDPLQSNRDPLQSSTEVGYMPQRFTQLAMYQFPEFKDMYYRRVATLYDQIYKSGQLLNWYAELFNKSKNTIDEDLVKWQAEKAALLSLAFPTGIPWEFPDDFPYDITPEQAVSGEATAETQDVMFRYGYARFITRIESERGSGNLPQTQSTNPEVIFSELNYNPSSSQDDQYIELYNPNSEAVDLSGWELSGVVSAQLPQGSVIPAHSYALIVKNDLQFRQSYGGSQLILAQYQGSLPSQSSNQLRLSHDGQTSAQFSYAVDEPWPSSANGSGLSLALADLSGDYTSPYCWAPSTTNGGTPGTINNPSQTWVAQNIGKCSARAKRAASSLAGTGQASKIFILLGTVLSLSGAMFFLGLKSRSKLLMIKNVSSSSSGQKNNRFKNG